MKMLFGKYWWLIPAVVVIILTLAVLVQYTKDTSDVARWVFNFLKEWAIILSASITAVLVIAAFMGIRENRRAQAVDRVRGWVDRLLKLFITEVDADEKDIQLQIIWVETFAILGDAKVLGGAVEERTKGAASMLEKLVEPAYIKDKAPPDDKLVTNFLNSLYDILEAVCDL